MKKILFSIAVMAVSATAIVAVASRGGSDSLFETNVEVLARGESSTGRAVCYSQYTPNDNSSCLICVECTYKSGIGSQKGGYCKW